MRRDPDETYDESTNPGNGWRCPEKTKVESAEVSFESLMGTENLSMVLDKFEYFYGRWQDEKQYEDWNDYVTAMKNFFSQSPWKVESFRNRPFELRVSRSGVQGFIKISGRKVVWGLTLN